MRKINGFFWGGILRLWSRLTAGAFPLFSTYIVVGFFFWIILCLAGFSGLGCYVGYSSGIISYTEGCVFFHHRIFFIFPHIANLEWDRNPREQEYPDTAETSFKLYIPTLFRTNPMHLFFFFSPSCKPWVKTEIRVNKSIQKRPRQVSNCTLRILPYRLSFVQNQRTSRFLVHAPCTGWIFAGMREMRGCG